MTTQEFFSELDARIARYDLLCHPFYKAWSAGELTREDLREYAEDYYHHVDAFPTYLAEFGVRLEEGELRRAVVANLSDEKGGEDAFGMPGRAHSELWLDFAEGMGASRNLHRHASLADMARLIKHFSQVAREGSPEEALAAFYAYESQVPRVAGEKARGLRERYGADEKTCGYFTLHATADVYHSRVWRQQLEKRLKANPQAAEAALDAAEAAAKALWRALDGIEQRRMARVAA
ncbi:MAG TPA: iron-containing redox enzyme family protein [Terriglobales bacterium]|jgi:pyrroloquinoline-quinone synthase